MHLKPGATIENGKFRIIEMIGQGGFGITYLAEHTATHIKVAVKEFFPKNYCVRDHHTGFISVATPANRQLVEKMMHRFIREAENLKRLDHQGIVRIHDIFYDFNTAYYVMEYIDGVNLSQLVKSSGRLDESSAVRYIAEIGEALCHMHSKNMTHFDIKPGNIMLRRSDDRPILIDFGLSVQYSQDGDRTTTNLTAASPGYSALEMYNPEQLKNFSPQTDVYSLGATLYYLLTGEAPPPAVDLVAASPSFPSFVNPRLAAAIRKSMLSRANRTQSVREFISQIKSSDGQSWGRAVEPQFDDEIIDITDQLDNNEWSQPEYSSNSEYPAANNSGDYNSYAVPRRVAGNKPDKEKKNTKYFAMIFTVCIIMATLVCLIIGLNQGGNKYPDYMYDTLSNIEEEVVVVEDTDYPAVEATEVEAYSAVDTDNYTEPAYYYNTNAPAYDSTGW